MQTTIKQSYARFHTAAAARNAVSSTRRASALCARVFVLPLALSACDALTEDTPENLGTTDSPVVGEVSDPSQGFSVPASTFVGRWLGEAEDPLSLGATASGSPPAYKFPSGSSQIALEISPQGAVAGKLTFGTGTPPPLATDGDLGYPVGFSYFDLFTYADPSRYTAADNGPLPPFEGFTYTLLDPDFSTKEPLADGLLHLYYRTNEILGDWCEMQQPFPVPDSGGAYSCNEGLVALPAGEPGNDSSCPMSGYAPYLECPPGVLECEEQGEPVAALGSVDCNKAFLCEKKFCGCTAQGCSVAASPTFDRTRAQLTLRRAGDELVGVIGNAAFLNERNAVSPLGRIRFRRPINSMETGY